MTKVQPFPGMIPAIFTLLFQLFMFPMQRTPFFKSSLLALLLLSQQVMAQQPVTNGVEMADRLRADGKIWVVVAVIATVFAGIVVYLIRLDRQIGKLEKEVQNQKKDVRQKTSDLG
jgi:beta-lactamase regulating signal transducer with metallopeptidase domain